MRHKFTSLTLFATALGALAFGQQAVETPSKPAAQSPDAAKPAKQAEKGDKPAATSSDKPGTGLKLGVATESEKLLDEAISKVEAIKKFRAQIRQKTDILGYTFLAEGQFAVAPDFHLLYELKVQLTGDTTGVIKEVCDGRTHWRNQKVLDSQELVKLDIAKLRDVFDKPQFNKEIRDQLIRQLGFSGMVPLLKGLRESQKFESHAEETLGDHEVYVLHGEWREEVMNQASFRGQQLSLARLPAYIPSKCTVWIDRKSGWLHKVAMEGAKKVQGSLTTITVEFLDPQIDVDLPESLFAFEPPTGVRTDDQTDLMYQRLNLILQQGQNPDRRPGSSSAPLDSTNPQASPADQPAAKPLTKP